MNGFYMWLLTFCITTMITIYIYWYENGKQRSMSPCTILLIDQQFFKRFTVPEINKKGDKARMKTKNVIFLLCATN